MAREKPGLDPLGPEQTVDFATKQLDRVLGFFPRVDAKINALLAIIVGLLGVLVVNFQRGDQHIWYLALPYAATAALAALALYHLYRASFPTLEGGADSLVYFREIRKNTEPKYVEKTLKMSQDALARDLLGQIWRNSEILTQKYEHVKCAFFATGGALALWLISLLLSTIVHGQFIAR